MKNKIILLILLVFIMFSIRTFSFSEEIIYPIEVVSDISEGNILGNNFVHTIKENFREASNMKLKSSGNRIIVKIDIISKEPNYPNDAIIYSVIWILSDIHNNTYYINNTIGYCGRTVYEDSAKGIVASTDAIIDRIKSQYEQ